jgi:pyrroline-5-carboxylate reductase
MAIPLTGKLLLLGAGKMGGAMLQGWLKAGVDPSRIGILEPSPSPDIVQFMANHKIQHNPMIDELRGVQVIVAAVKPQIMDQVLPDVTVLKRDNPLILSIAAGKTMESFDRYFGPGAAIIRTIPNTPAAIGQGITVMVRNSKVSVAQAELASALLACLGEVVEVEDEALIDAATAVSGSGPAYIFYMTECLAKAAEAVGLSPDTAMKLARATVSGSAALMQQTGVDAAQLRKNVTSPNGTTFAALQVLMGRDGIEKPMIDAVAAAAQRSKELAS